VEKHVQVSQSVREQAKKTYARPELVRQGKVEELTQHDLYGCSKPITQ
jgi:hypothetical protein